ncbi:UNVERIFIED_CONTAM: hypothetical protein FKN15_042861 [Acipenser sinensis]
MVCIGSLEQAKVSGVPLPPEQDLGLLDPSVAAVLRSKPDYQRILRGQIPVVSRLDLVMDSHQKLLRSLRSFQDEAERTLKETSSRLGKKPEKKVNRNGKEICEGCTAKTQYPTNPA